VDETFGKGNIPMAGIGEGGHRDQSDGPGVVVAWPGFEAGAPAVAIQFGVLSRLNQYVDIIILILIYPILCGSVFHHDKHYLHTTG
jgi:hypothetical protein